ncbi:MAG: DUF3021 domain-containing protein [Eubacteriaceae bacterium]
MLKKIFYRGLLGFPQGIALGYVITIFISLIHGQGYYSPCIPSLVETMENEINAVILQALLCGLLGTTFASCSVIWECDNWSIVKQTSLYFFITALVMLPIAYFTNWMEHSFIGFITYSIIFVFIFIVIWLLQYFIWKHKIKLINEKLNKK